MGIGYFPYFFDNSGFLRELSPLIPQLESGEYWPLYNLAKQTLEAKPELWKILYDLNLGYSFNDEKERLEPNSLLMKVLVKYLELIPIEDRNAWRMLEPSLPLIGWGNEETHLLLFGKSLCSLLVPNNKDFPEYYFIDSENKKQIKTPWCRGFIGWLDIETIASLLDHLSKSESNFHGLIESQDKRIQDHFSYVRDLSPEWLAMRLEESFRYTLEILSSAYSAHKSLALAIA